MADNFCVEHQVVWFKKGKMRGFAHPLEDANGEIIGWCNKPQELPPPQGSDKLLPEHQAMINKAREEARRTMGGPAKAEPIDKRSQSIEQQVAIKEIGECWRVGKFGDDSDEVVAYRLWLLNQISDFYPFIHLFSVPFFFILLYLSSSLDFQHSFVCM